MLLEILILNLKQYCNLTIYSLLSTDALRMSCENLEMATKNI